MAAPSVTPSYSRAEARRLLRVTEQQLRGWERQKLLAPAADYGFRELLALRTLIQLRKNRVPPIQIKRAIAALRKTLSGIENPLTELKLFAEGRRVRVELEGGTMEAESGQLLFNFNHAELTRLLQFQAKKDNAQSERQKRREAEQWFERGLEMERNGAPPEEIIEAYQKAIALDWRTAGAYVNLGTIYFNARRLDEAERYYKKALEADPDYSLAHFDLGNLYDERGERALARDQYLEALRVTPGYADAHYNLALLYQSEGQPMKAVHHWVAYLKLDPTSQWAEIARRELGKLRRAAVVQGARGSQGSHN